MRQLRPVMNNYCTYRNNEAPRHSRKGAWSVKKQLPLVLDMKGLAPASAPSPVATLSFHRPHGRHGGRAKQVTNKVALKTN